MLSLKNIKILIQIKNIINKYIYIYNINFKTLIIFDSMSVNYTVKIITQNSLLVFIEHCRNIIIHVNKNYKNKYKSVLNYFSIDVCSRIIKLEDEKDLFKLFCAYSYNGLFFNHISNKNSKKYCLLRKVRTRNNYELWIIPFPF